MSRALWEEQARIRHQLDQIEADTIQRAPWALRPIVQYLLSARGEWLLRRLPGRR